MPIHGFVSWISCANKNTKRKFHFKQWIKQSYYNLNCFPVAHCSNVQDMPSLLVAHATTAVEECDATTDAITTNAGTKILYFTKWKGALLINKTSFTLNAMILL